MAVVNFGNNMQQNSNYIIFSKVPFTLVKKTHSSQTNIFLLSSVGKGTIGINSQVKQL